MSFQLLNQCLTASGTATNIAVNQNNSSPDISMCITGARTEVITISAANSNNAAIRRVPGADHATALCNYTSSGFLVALPNGNIQYVKASSADVEDDIADNKKKVVDATLVGTCPTKGTHFTALASSPPSTSTSAGAVEETAPFAYAATRDELFYIDASSVAFGASKLCNTNAPIISLGRIAGAAGLPISKIAVVPENPYLLIVAVHNRLLQIDTRESKAFAAAVGGVSAGPSSGNVLGPQRSWLLPVSNAMMATTSTKVTSLSVSGTWLSAGTSDGRLCVWDVRGGSSKPTDVNGLLLSSTVTDNTPLDIVDVAVRSSSTALVSSSSSSIYSASLSHTTVTSCSIVGAGTVFTTDMKGVARVWMRPSATLPFEGLTLCPFNVVNANGKGGASTTSTVTSPSFRCGAVGSRLGGHVVFAAVDDLGVVSVFGEGL